MRFVEALSIIQEETDKAMRLPQWEEDVRIKAQYPDAHSKMTHPYLYVESRFGYVPWKETFVEMFETGWEIV